MKPLIGITTLCEERARRPYACVSAHYIKAIELAGGIPILIPARLQQENIEYYLELLDGLVLSGGEDIHPSLYGEEPIAALGEVCADRDEIEMQIFLKALEKQMPILGICRGQQVINVALGGTLYQDIKEQQGSAFNHLALEDPVEKMQHEVTLEKASTLYGILGKEEISVNSLHHQAIKDLGHKLKVMGVSFDGVIEAIEYEGESFVLGVQWHPEDLAPEDENSLKLFQELVAQATKR